MAWLAWAVTVGLAGAQSTAPPPEPGDTVEAVTVIAPPPPEPQILESLVDKLALPDERGRVVGQIPRWIRPVCPIVMGTNPRAAAYLAQRVRQTAREVDAPVARGRCRPNLIVAVTDEGDRLVEQLAAKHRYRIFGRGRHGELEAFTAPARPVRWWHLSETGPAYGVTPGFPDAPGGKAGLPVPEMRLDPSRIRVSTSESTTAVLVIVDAKRVAGVLPRAVSAYVAMVGLASLPQAPDLPRTETVLNLFDAPSRSRPRDLTRYDRAYLRALYKMPLNARYTRQRDQIAARMQDALAKAEPAEVGPTP